MRSAYNYDDHDGSADYDDHRALPKSPSDIRLCASDDTAARDRSANDILNRSAAIGIAAYFGVTYNADDVPESGPTPEHPA